MELKYQETVDAEVFAQYEMEVLVVGVMEQGLIFFSRI